jgi:hypothetical protein
VGTDEVGAGQVGEMREANCEKCNTKTSYTEISDGKVSGCDIPVVL